MKPAFAALLLVCLIISSSMFEITVLGVELQYNSLDINDKLLLELQSIGLDLEPVYDYYCFFLMPEMVQEDDEAILEDITRLEELYQGQVSNKRNLLDGLLKSASAAKELVEKDFDQRALDQLVVTAYEKYTVL
ncbi:unnamed protein product [Vicia faba]|uniref:Uncharacterized protein n=1 Tax=Vicia faba TaxID=3906 RepID=A0AAV1A138_VICFA|nr:unnamed protein product [Vicia faba]